MHSSIGAEQRVDCLYASNVQVFGGDCDVYEGGLYINVGFLNPQGTINPDVQGALDVLGLGNLSSIGLLHVSIGGAGQTTVEAIDFLPSLQVADHSHFSGC